MPLTPELLAASAAVLRRPLWVSSLERAIAADALARSGAAVALLAIADRLNRAEQELAAELARLRPR